MWVESAPLVWDRVKVSENLRATTIALVAPAVTSLSQWGLLSHSDKSGGYVSNNS